MAFVAPAVEDFLDRFPEFSDLDEGQIQIVLDEVVPMVDEEWIDRDRPIAILYLTAHLLYIQSGSDWSMALRRSFVNSAGQIGAGPALNETVGPLSVSYASPKDMLPRSQAGSGASSSFDLETSPYGLRYLDLLRRSAPAVLVV